MSFPIRTIEFLYRNRFAWILALVFSALIAVVLLIGLPRKYYSDAKLIVKIGRESVGLDPTATTSQTLLMQKTQEEEINTALGVLSSRAVKEDVVRRIGVEQILKGRLAPEEDGSQPTSKVHEKIGDAIDWAGNFLLEIGVRDEVDDFERAIIKLDESVYVSASQKSQIVDIYAEAKSPELAQEIAHQMSDAFRDKHIQISQTIGSFELFETEVKLTKERLVVAQKAKADFMSEHQIVSVSSNQELLKNAWDGILTNIMRLETEESMLAAKYSKDHPQRVAVIAQLESARKVLNRIRQKSGKALPDGVVDVEKIEASDVTLSDVPPETVSLIQKIDELIASNSKLEAISSNVQMLEDQLRVHRTNLESARMIRMQEENKISNIDQFQSASLNRKPISPNKILVCAASVFFSFFFAFLMGLWGEARRKKSAFRKAEDVERSLKVPVVATIPVDRSANNKCKNTKSMHTIRAKCHEAVHTIMQERSESGQKGAVVLGVLSIEKGNGGSTVASALAACCSKDFGLKTLLVDADLKSRSVSSRFSLNGAPGLQEMVTDDEDLDRCIQRFEPFGLSLVSSTNKSRNEAVQAAFPADDVLGHLDRLKNQFDVVIVDLPPASEANSAVFLATRLERVFLVAEASKTTTSKAVGVLRKFETSDTDVSGMILNKYRCEFPWEKNA